MSVFEVKQSEILKLIDHIQLMGSILESFISLRLSTIRNSIDSPTTKSIKIESLTKHVARIRFHLSTCVMITELRRLSVDKRQSLILSGLPITIIAHTTPATTTPIYIPTRTQRLPTSKKLLIKTLGQKLQELHQNKLPVLTKSNLMKAGFKDHYARKLATSFGSSSVITKEGLIISVPNLHHIILLNIFLIYALSELDTNRSRGISSLWISKKIRRLLQGSYDLPSLNVMSEKLSSCIDLNSINFYCENLDVMTHLLYQSLCKSNLVSDSNLYTLEQILNRLLVDKSEPIPLLKAI
jgi:hypothetical protein